MNVSRVATGLCQVGCLLAALLVSAPAQAGRFELVSRAAVESDTAENGLANLSELPASSADGRWVAFSTPARNLVVGQQGSFPGHNVFLRDRQAGTTVLVSHAAGSDSMTGNGDSWRASLSADGRRLVYFSFAKNLLPGQSPTLGPPAHVFLYDRDAGANVLVSHSTSGAESAGSFQDARISADGNWIVFVSSASDLVPGLVLSEPAQYNVFLYQVATGQISLVSRAAGTQVNGVGGVKPALSADGRYVAFQSSATGLVPGYTASGLEANDVFLFDRVAGSMTLVSHTSASATAGASGSLAVVSADGSRVAFVSRGTNVVAGQADSNGGYDAFLFTRATGANVLVSRSAASATTAGNHGVEEDAPLQLSATGAYVAFSDSATDAVAGQVDSGFSDDIFLFTAATSSLTLVSRSSSSPVAAANGESDLPSLSADGRFVAFQSLGRNLVAGQSDHNGYTDIFLFDRTTGTNVLASGAGGSAQTTGELHSFSPTLSADGGAIAFRSWAEDLAAGSVDLNGDPDIVVYDRAAGHCELASLHAPGMASVSAAEFSMLASASADGRYAVLLSWARNLVSGQVDHNLGGDVFLVDRTTGAATLVSHSTTSATTAGNRESGSALISADGAWVLFSSIATDLVPGQVDSVVETPDLFLYERATGTVTLVSHAAGTPTATANRGCGSWDWFDGYFPAAMAISVDGRQIAFECEASNLAPGQTEGNNSGSDVFLHDRITGQTSVVSHNAASATTTGNSYSRSPRISADGRWLAFLSFASDLVPGSTDGNGAGDVFLNDRDSGQTLLVSRAAGTAATAANARSERLALSPDGRHVVFSSLATNLVPGQTDAPRASGDDDDVFLFDRLTGVVELISRAAGSASTTGNDRSEFPAVSADGRYVVFSSLATNLVPGQSGAAGGVFVHDRVTRRMELISRSGASPAQTTGVTANPVLSTDGRYVAYVAARTLFVADRQLGSLERVAKAADYFSTGDLSTALSLPALVGDGSTVLFDSDDVSVIGSDFNDTFDVLAYVRTDPAAGDYFTLTPCRLLDTRQSGPAPVSGQTLLLAVHGACGVPDTATAVAVNVTVLQGSGAGLLAVSPGNVLTGTSTLNFAAGATRANNAIIPLAANGEGTLGLSPFVTGGGPVHVIVDVSGYFE